MRKSYPSTGFEPAAFGLPVRCSTTGAKENRQKHAKRLNIKALACKPQNIRIKLLSNYSLLLRSTKK